MSKVRRILVPVDFSEQASQALRYGIALARSTGAELFLLHVVQELTPIGAGSGALSFKTAGEYAKEVEQQAQEGLLKMLPVEMTDGLRVRRRTVIGFPWQDVVEFARSNEIDMICLGTHGRSGFKRLVLGSVAEKVVQHAHCNVLAVRTPEGQDVPTDQSPPAFRRVLVPTDFSDCSELAVTEGASWSARFNAELHLLHVVEDNSPSVAETSRSHPVFQTYYQELLRGGEKRLSEATVAGLPAEAIRRKVEVGDPIDKINRYAAEQGIELIVMGTHGRQGPSRWLIGSVAERVVRSAPCPVLVVRHCP
ncbi:MAG TPA: universal stress protein [Caulifigura sp.]|nr:universal stress protein [Caulifigura sp.]